METERLQEIAAATGCRVDRKNGVIRGVKIIGRESRNGREYTVRALQDAAALYENVKVNVGHLGPGENRKYQDRIGKLENARVQNGGIYADFRYNVGHALAEQLAWDAENAPGNVGLSHDVEGRITRRNGRVMVEEILSVRSVDLVADPASTGGLFEGEQARETFPVSSEFSAMLRGEPTFSPIPAGQEFADTLRGESVDSAAVNRFANAIRE